MRTLGDIEELIEYCPEVFQECEVVYENDWSTYEESGWVVVFRFFDELMEWEGGYYCFSDDNTPYFDPNPIDEEEFEQLKIEWLEKEGFQE